MANRNRLVRKIDAALGPDRGPRERPRFGPGAECANCRQTIVVGRGKQVGEDEWLCITCATNPFAYGNKRADDGEWAGDDYGEGLYDTTPDENLRIIRP
jgi:hypothetical protein